MSTFLQFLWDDRLQAISSLGSIGMVVLIVRLIQRRVLKEEYAILWLVTFSFFILISVFRSLLELVARLAGIYYAPAALLLLLILGVMMILVHYSTVISKLSEQNKSLAQELAILKDSVQKLSESRRESWNEPSHRTPKDVSRNSLQNMAPK